MRFLNSVNIYQEIDELKGIFLVSRFCKQGEFLLKHDYKSIHFLIGQYDSHENLEFITRRRRSIYAPRFISAAMTASAPSFRKNGMNPDKWLAGVHSRSYSTGPMGRLTGLCRRDFSTPFSVDFSTTRAPRKLPSDCSELWP